MQVSDVLAPPGVLQNVVQEGEMRNEPTRAACLGGGGLVLGRVHDVDFEYTVSRFKDTSLIPLLLTQLCPCF